MRSKGSGAELERIRKLAVKAVLAGHKQKDVAEIFDVHFKTLSSWVCSYRIDPDSLQARPNTGRPPQLTAENLVQLKELLVLGPRNHGWKTDIWTSRRVAVVIEKEFGIKFHPDHVFKILTKQLNWSWQKPSKKAEEQNPLAVTNWIEVEWPTLKKTLTKKKRQSPSSTKVAS